MKRRRMRFSMRTLVVGVTLCAVTAGSLTLYVRGQLRAFQLEQHTLVELGRLAGELSVVRKPRGPDWLKKWGDGKYAERVTILSIKSPEFSNHHLAKLKAFKYLENLGIDGAQPLKDVDLVELAGISDLWGLSISRTSVRSTSAESLRTLASVINLTFVHDAFTGNDAEWISGLSGLENLEIHAPVRDTHLRALANLPNLKGLAIKGGRVTDEGLASLASIEKLRVLALVDCTVTDEGMKYLKPLKNLQRLIIRSHPGRTRIAQSLDMAPSLPDTELPLIDAVEMLGHTIDVAIEFDEENLGAAGIAYDGIMIEPTNVHGLEARELLAQLLGPHGLVAVVQADGMLITTQKGADSLRPGVTELQQTLPNVEVNVSW